MRSSDFLEKGSLLTALPSYSLLEREDKAKQDKRDTGLSRSFGSGAVLFSVGEFMID